MRQILINAYLDYVNNYLTVAKWAEHNGLPEDDAQKLLRYAQRLHENQIPHPDA